MKGKTTLFALVLGLCAQVGAGQMNMPPAKSNAAFDQLKSLEGNWEGQASDGKTTRVSYQLVSAGTCLMETLESPEGPSMITMYHLNGGRVVLDHYCSLNNVPHMKGTASPDGKKFDFAFVSGANMASSSDMHMHSLKLSFEDSDHFTQEWTLRSKGKDQPVVFHFQRAR